MQSMLLNKQQQRKTYLKVEFVGEETTRSVQIMVASIQRQVAEEWMMEGPQPNIRTEFCLSRVSRINDTVNKHY